MTTLGFLHANGFPADTYRQLFQIWQPHYRVLALPMLGHDQSFPVVAHWRKQADEWVAWLQAHSDSPVWGVGHSLGAVVTFMAAWSHPHLFQGIILLDPPLINGPAAYGFALTKLLGRVDEVTPAGRTAGRRQVWPDWESARTYFMSKSLYRHFDPRCLEDYMRSGLQQQADGSLFLRFRPEIEVALFRTTPYDSWRYRRALQVPGFLVRGTSSQVTTVAAAQRMVQRHGLGFREVTGAHMFPLEQPEMTAQVVLDLIKIMRHER
ncbi:MAG: alpha/beta hydrolase [Pseudomonadales bacterium]|nr:alpha/beta hydrolase [Pseudomonadales bacterium]